MFSYTAVCKSQPIRWVLSQRLCPRRRRVGHSTSEVGPVERRLLETFEDLFQETRLGVRGIDWLASWPFLLLLSRWCDMWWSFRERSPWVWFSPKSGRTNFSRSYREWTNIERLEEGPLKKIEYEMGREKLGKDEKKRVPPFKSRKR